MPDYTFSDGSWPPSPTTKPTISKAEPELWQKIAKIYVDSHDENKVALDWPDIFAKKITDLFADQQRQLLDRLLEHEEEYYVIDEGGYEAEKDPTIAVPVSVIKDIREGLGRG